MEPEGFVEIARLLPSLAMPVRVIYGERDRILPDVGETMTRVKQDLPQAEVTALPECGHFLQEEAPDEVGALLARFFAGLTPLRPQAGAQGGGHLEHRSAGRTAHADGVRESVDEPRCGADRLTGTPASPEPPGVLLALVAQHVEPRDGDMCGWQALQLGGQHR